MVIWCEAPVRKKKTATAARSAEVPSQRASQAASRHTPWKQKHGDIITVQQHRDATTGVIAISLRATSEYNRGGIVAAAAAASSVYITTGFGFIKNG